MLCRQQELIMMPFERVSLQAVGDLLVLALLELAIFILFTGIFVGLWILASLSLLKRGLGKSRARWAQFIALLMTFLAGIGPSITTVANFAIAAGTLNLGLATTGDSALYSIARDWTLQINLLVNDVVVIWRAWTLYSDNAIVMSSLSFMFCATAATTFASLVLVTRVIEFQEAANVLSTEALANILNTTSTALSLATNIFATSLIFFQFWRERRFNDRSGLHRSSLTSSQRIMLLLVEAGFIFCVAEVVGLCFGIYNARNRTIPAMTRIVLVGIDTMLWALLPLYFPAVILIIANNHTMVENFTFHSDLVAGTAHVEAAHEATHKFSITDHHPGTARFLAHEDNNDH